MEIEKEFEETGLKPSYNINKKEKTRQNYFKQRPYINLLWGKNKRQIGL